MDVTKTSDNLRALLAEDKDAEIRDICNSFHPAALADHFEHLEPEERVQVLQCLDPLFRAELIGHLDPNTQLDTVEVMPDAELARTVTNMSADERVDLLKLLPDERVEEVLRTVAKAEREDILRLGAYKEGTAGAIMTSEYVSIPPDITAREALDKLRLEAPNKETIYCAYVVDNKRRLLGLISLKDLIVARGHSLIEDLMTKEAITVLADEPQEEVARKLSQYDLIAIPVVNGNNTLVGIVTFDDVLDVTEAEATTDFHRIGASGSLKESLRDASLGLLYRKRVPWLLILVFINIFSGAAIARYEEVIEAYVALVFFLPLLIDSGGNAGTQSATLMVRALATGDVQLRDWFKLLSREVGVAAAIGLSMAVAVSFLGIYRGGAEIAVVVSSTMIIVVLVGSLIGMSLPFAFTRLKLDPAAASGPLVTSLADIAGVLIYFGIAAWYLDLPLVAAA